jgi:hypothetical protein
MVGLLQDGNCAVSRHQSVLDRSTANKQECHDLETLLEKYQERSTKTKDGLAEPDTVIKSLNDLKGMLMKFKDIDLSPAEAPTGDRVAETRSTTFHKPTFDVNRDHLRVEFGSGEIDEGVSYNEGNWRED